MPKCPFCNEEVAFNDFFNKQPKLDRKGEIKGYNFEIAHEFEQKIYGNNTVLIHMYVCPHCDKILGFSERPMY